MDQTPTVWIAPTSFGQERLWLASRLDPTSGAFNLTAPIYLPDDLSVDQLHEALRLVVARHEPLRTCLREVEGRVEQVILDEVPVVISGTDREPVERTGETLRVADFLRFAAGTDLPLDQAPLWRATARRVVGGGWLLFLVLHHTVFDGASYPVFAEELDACAHAVARGTTPDLPELEIQYGDYAHWLRELLDGERLDTELGYWRERLQGAPPVHALPLDRPRPAVASSRGGEVILEVPASVQAGVGEAAAALRATTAMVQLASWIALLARLSGERDLVVGVPFAGRPTAQTAPLVGMFVNTLPIRVQLTPDPTMREIVTAVRAAVLDATEHQLVPFQRLVEEFAPPRGSVHPIYQLGFNQLPLAALNYGYGTTRDELGLEIAGDAARIEYRTDLFDASTVERLGARWLRMTDALLASLDRPLSQTPWLTDDETTTVVDRWNDTGDPAVGLAGGSVVERMVRVWAEDSDALAVTDGRVRADRATFAARTAELAARLRRAGVGPESVVGVSLRRSVDLAVAVAGVLRAGAAFCPLDPDYPAERLAYMAADAGLAAVITHDGGPGFPVPDGVDLIDVGERVASDVPPSTTWDRPITGDQAAYVLYTSGSTGRPKGAINTHAAIANRIDWMQRAYRLAADDVVLQKTPTSFDVSVWEFLWPLAVGARLVMAEPGAHQDPIRLRRTVIEEGVTTMHFVPSMLAAFLAVPDVADCTSLRRVICSGEELPPALVRRFFEALPGCELHNLYGPTEAAIDVTSWDCGAQASLEARVPIGRPITNLRCLVLDEALRPLPPGVVGDLYLAGAGLGRGYLRRPGLTADRFLPDPYGPAGSRMYATGDRARWLPDGALDFLGRTDGQVKLRGQRVELGELESVLTEHPHVTAAAARVVEPQAGDQRLHAYAVTADGTDLDAVRAWLATRLPDALVPQSITRLDALPLGPSGKLDRDALPEPETATGAPGDRTGAAPTTEVQRSIAAIVSGVLDVEEVFLDDDFFALGGHSLLAAQVTSRIAADLGVEIGIDELFAAPTVAGIAIAVEDRLGRGDIAASRAVRIPPGTDARVLSFAQERVWFMEQYAPGTAAYCVPVAVRLSGPLDARVLAEAIATVSARQESLRMRFPADQSGQPTVVVDPATDTPDLTSETVADEPTAWERARDLAGTPFD
ncbi:amino acid adenylation domain-containing protein, partial [Nocardioides sp. GXZ039]|uniref:amino acid adenylation domain-containing protein n=1 Tax=Nocardioides sp. GXZ039 TaxID=3136018 RepID=UPI0030F3BE87